MRLINPSRVTICAVCLVAFGCDNRPNQWDAFVYSSPDLDDVEKIRGFKSFELCQQAAIDRLRAEGNAADGDYECGFKCEPTAAGNDVCKETRK